jgi:hypothetical protein
MLRQRVQRLSTFRHPSFAAVRTVEHLDGGGLSLVSNHAHGTRLSEWVEARRTPQGLHPALVSWLVQQITTLVAALQAHGYDIVHGALTIDRLVLTSDGHISIVEHVLGSALRGLERSPARLWRDFGIIARPTSRGEACLDAPGDILQVGVVALSLLLGRRITLVEVQHQLPTLLDEFSAMPMARASVFAWPLRLWIERAMQQHPQAYRSAAEAQEGLRQLPDQGASSLPALLNSMMPGATAALPEPTVGSMVPETTGDLRLAAASAASGVPPVTEPVGVRNTPSTASGTHAPPYTATADAAPVIDLATLQPPVAADIRRASDRVLEMASVNEARPARLERRTPLGSDPSLLHSMRRWVMIGLALIAFVEAAVIAVLATRHSETPAAAAAAPIAITVDAAQAGSTVFVDNKPAGTTPLTLTIDGNSRSIRIAGNGAAAPDVPAGIGAVVATGPGTQGASTAIARAAARQRSGGVRFISPIDLQVLEGNRVLGRTADGPIIGSDGTHELDLVNSELGFRMRQVVTFKAGEIASFTVPIPMGRLSIEAQPSALVWVDQNAVGETPLVSLSGPIGQHQVTFRHPEFGERKEIVVVRADGITRLSTTFDRSSPGSDSRGTSAVNPSAP